VRRVSSTPERTVWVRSKGASNQYPIGEAVTALRTAPLTSNAFGDYACTPTRVIENLNGQFTIRGKRV